MTRRNRTPSSVLTDAGVLNVAVCEQARVKRDRRYDGLFFSGVRTTKIYCRPVCPVHPAKARNVTFYPSAAAAEQDGFRPCLRCRPEAAPFSPAWKGSPTTVQRAVKGRLNSPCASRTSKVIKQPPQTSTTRLVCVMRTMSAQMLKISMLVSANSAIMEERGIND